MVVGVCPSVRLSVVRVPRPNSTTRERKGHSKSKIGMMEAHITRVTREPT